MKLNIKVDLTGAVRNIEGLTPEQYPSTSEMEGHFTAALVEMLSSEMNIENVDVKIKEIFE